MVHPRDIAAWFRPSLVHAFLLASATNRPLRQLLLRVRERFEQCRLAGLGDTLWTKHLTKSQLYGVLGQILLGASVGEVTIAKMALAEGGGAAGAGESERLVITHDGEESEEGHGGPDSAPETQHMMRAGEGGEGMDQQAGASADMAVTVGDGRSGGHLFVAEDDDDVEWPPRMERHVTWATVQGTTAAAEVSPVPAAASSSSAAPANAPAATQVTTVSRTASPSRTSSPPLSPSHSAELRPSSAGRPQQLSRFAVEARREEEVHGREGADESATQQHQQQQHQQHQHQQAGHGGQGGQGAGQLPPRPPGKPPRAPPTPATPSSRPPLPPGAHAASPLSSLSGAGGAASSGRNSEGDGSSDEILPASSGRSGGKEWGHERGRDETGGRKSEEGEGGEYLEARMNLTALSLTFQRHLAMLVRVEMKASSLRLLLRSEAVPDLIAWLTSPAW